jgi:hypothetical protein
MVHQSSVLTTARGVELSQDGSYAQVGMIGNTCQIDVQTGLFATDLDVVPNEEDVVLDVFANQTLVIGEGRQGLTVMKNDWSGDNYRIDVGNVQHATFGRDQVVVVTGDNQSCSLQSYDGGQMVGEVEVPCQINSLNFNSQTSTSYLSTGSNVIVVGPSGVSAIDFAPEIISFNQSLGIFYGATDNYISAVNEVGEVLWTKTFQSDVYAMDDVESSGDLIVIIGSDSMGEVIVLDGGSGEVKSTFLTPGISEGNRIRVSDNGQSMAIVLRDAIHFYKIGM